VRADVVGGPAKARRRQVLQPALQAHELQILRAMNDGIYPETPGTTSNEIKALLIMAAIVLGRFVILGTLSFLGLIKSY
jgi:hypothetical protein